LGITLLMAAGGTAIVFLAALFLKETAHVRSGNVQLQTVPAEPL
jgi:hypothetical protein